MFTKGKSSILKEDFHLSLETNTKYNLQTKSKFLAITIDLHIVQQFQAQTYPLDQG